MWSRNPSTGYIHKGTEISSSSRMASSAPVPYRACLSGWVMGVTEQQMTNDILFHAAFTGTVPKRKRWQHSWQQGRTHRTRYYVKQARQKETSVSRPYSRVRDKKRCQLMDVKSHRAQGGWRGRAWQKTQQLVGRHQISAWSLCWCSSTGWGGYS